MHGPRATGVVTVAFVAACVAPQSGSRDLLEVHDASSGDLVSVTVENVFCRLQRTSSRFALDGFGELRVGDSASHRSFCRAVDWSRGPADLRIFETHECDPELADDLLCFTDQTLASIDDDAAIVLDGCILLSWLTSPSID